MTEIEKVTNIPDELKRCSHWIVWRYETRQGGKSTKVPYNPKTGTYASTVDPATWATFDEALAALETGRLGGVGFVFTSADPFVGVDLDDCVDDNGSIQPWAQDLVARLDSYTELTPSGHGLHIIIKVQGKSGLPSGRKAGNIEFYTTDRFFTVTGDRLKSAPAEIHERQKELELFIQEVFGACSDLQTTGGELDLPTEAEVQALVKAADQVVPDIHNLLYGDWPEARTDGLDRSGMEYLLARRLVEHGFTDLETVAKILYGSAIHKAKAAGRRPSASWRLALDCAAHALEREAAVSNTETERDGPVNRNLILPEECYLGVAKDFAELFDPFYEVPKEFLYFSFLTVIGPLLAGKLTLNSDLRVEPRLFTVLLGRSGIEKKSTAKRLAVEFLEEVGYAPYILSGVGSAEGLAEVAMENHRLLLTFDEFKSFMSKAQIENSLLLPMVCKLFEETDYANATKKHLISLKDFHLGLLACSTIETYNLVWDEHSTSIGFNNRLFIVPAETTKTIPFVEKIPEDAKDKLSEKVKALFSEFASRQKAFFIVNANTTTATVETEQTLVLNLTPEAKSAWENWYLNQRPRDVYATRLDTIGMRLMILLAFCQGNFDVVDEATVEAVIKILQWQHAVRELYDPIDAQNQIARVEEVIRRHLKVKGGLTKRELKRVAHAKNTGLYIFESALANLIQSGEVVFMPRRRQYFLTKEAI